MTSNNEKKLLTKSDINKVFWRSFTVNKLLFICAPAWTDTIEATLKAQFPQYEIVKSSNALLEIMPGGTTKGEAVKRICALRDISPKDAVAFGDNYNDVEMLELVGHGYLMSNAPELLKKHLPRHTADHDHDGIAEALAAHGIC